MKLRWGCGFCGNLKCELVNSQCIIGTCTISWRIGLGYILEEMSLSGALCGFLFVAK